jgi:hypothetical protein
MKAEMETRCAICWKVIPPGQVMVLDPRKRRRGFGVWSLCMNCFPGEPNRMNWVVKKCVHCRRPLFTSIENPPVVVACGDSCRDTARAKELRHRLRKEKRCLLCGESYTPKRTDSRYCSLACKQTAYRKRSNASLPPARIDRRFKGGGGVHEAVETKALSQRIIQAK